MSSFFSNQAYAGKPQNLLTNGNFESGSVLPWSGFGAGTIVADKTKAHSGTYCMEISGSALFLAMFSQPNVVPTPGMPYQISGWVRVLTYSGDQAIDVSVACFDNTDTIIEHEIGVINVNVSGWQYVSLTFVPPPNTAYMQAYCEVNGGTPSSPGPCSALFDDIVLSVVSPYYLNLFTSEYQNSPKLLAWAASLMRPLIDAATCSAAMPQAFDLNLAVGKQLDILGGILGQARTVGFQPSGGVSPVLDDTTYRLLLRATIVRNQWDGQVDSLYLAWQALFPGGRIIIQDNQNMTATILITGAFSSIIQDLIVNGYIIPRPQGVLYNYVFPVLPVFGWDRNDAYVAGWDVGHWT